MKMLKKLFQMKKRQKEEKEGEKLSEDEKKRRIRAYYEGVEHRKQNISHYEVLGVDKTASQQNISKTYRRLGIKYHPDKNIGDVEAAIKFSEIGTAYNALRDELYRDLYDRGLYGKMIPTNLFR